MLLICSGDVSGDDTDIIDGLQEMGFDSPVRTPLSPAADKADSRSLAFATTTPTHMRFDEDGSELHGPVATGSVGTSGSSQITRHVATPFRAAPKSAMKKKSQFADNSPEGVAVPVTEVKAFDDIISPDTL
jgi:hypothetical protein